MRYLVISDIHGNLPALTAVLRDCPPEAYDRLLVLGDLVGYGAEPGGVIERIRALTPHVVVRGNHDKAVCGLMNQHAVAYPLAQHFAQLRPVDGIEKTHDIRFQYPAAA